MQKKWKIAGGIVAGLIVIGMLSDGSDAEDERGMASPRRSAPTEVAKPKPKTPTAETPRPSRTPVDRSPKPWADAPKDGTWPGPDATDTSGDTSFGAMSKPPRLSEYSVGISKLPTLTTTDGGKTVTISSVIAVKRISDRIPDRSVSDDLKLSWEPGERAPEHRMNEAWGTRVDTTCTPAVMIAGESGECIVSFKAPASEIPNSYWQSWGNRVGTWPSQKAGGR